VQTSFFSQRLRVGTVALVVCCAAVLGGAAVTGHRLWQHLQSTAKVGPQTDGSTLTVTGQVLHPQTKEIFLKGRPVDMAFNATQTKLAILNMASVNLMDEASGAMEEVKTHSTSYCGIAFRPGDRELWLSEAVSTGTGSLYVIRMDAAGKSSGGERMKLPGNAFPAGIAFSADGRTAYIALNSRNSLAIIDAELKTVVKEIPVGLAPMFVKLSLDGKTAYVSNRGGDAPANDATHAYSNGTAMATDPQTGAVLAGTVSVVDLASGKAPEVVVGLAPTGLSLSPDGKTLAVTNSHSDSVSLIDTASLKAKTVSIPTLPDGLLGTAPSGVVFSADGNRLYVASALNNAVTVLDKLDKKSAEFAVAGAIPTGLFPVTLAMDAHGSLAVLNIKGNGNTDNGKGGHGTHSYEGSLMRIPVLSGADLKQATEQVLAANNPHFDSAGKVADLASLGIRHVILLVKENRTYDQVFGDMKQGNSDPQFLMYGRKITPNHHALAEKYVLLDNFYATGAISFDGHQWLEQGFVSDHVERSLTSHARGYAWNMEDALTVSPAGFIWQHARKPLEVRVGGVISSPTEFDPRTQAAHDINENAMRPWSDYWNAYKAGKWQGMVGGRAAVPAIAPIFDAQYPANAVIVTDQIRAEVFNRRIDEAEKKGSLPDLMVYGMTADHTMGTTPGAAKPASMVADNDFALGRMVERVSHSRFWSSTLILVVEDDAQGGVDHVDGHRTVALAIGPMVKRGAVDSNFYTQLSMARTLQDILHIEPRTHFLKAARPMSSIFTPQKDLSTYTVMQPNILLDDLNPPVTKLSGTLRSNAVASAKMNFRHVDDAPEDKLNRILWTSARGADVPYPKTRHTLPNTDR